MIADSQLAERPVEQTMGSSSVSNLRIAWQEVSFPVRIIAQLRAAIADRVPVGYEDETGFHYGMKASDGFFSI
ncbi:MAG: hypothetical protein WBN75_04750 [Verrucomicrobiia bacterium]|jgi:hypothetical protein